MKILFDNAAEILAFKTKLCSYSPNIYVHSIITDYSVENYPHFWSFVTNLPYSLIDIHRHLPLMSVRTEWRNVSFLKVEYLAVNDIFTPFSLCFGFMFCRFPCLCLLCFVVFFPVFGYCVLSYMSLSLSFMFFCFPCICLLCFVVFFLVFGYRVLSYISLS